jgi:hypothetical protein
VNYGKMSASQHNTEQGINRGIPNCKQGIPAGHVGLTCPVIRAGSDGRRNTL